MNNEPVAWMNKRGSVVPNDLKLHQKDDVLHFNDYTIPLYTHPAEPKELTVPKNSQDWKGMDGDRKSVV